MADGNFLHALGIDAQLITAGSLGGLVKALMSKQRVFDAMASMVVGAAVSNYAGAALATLISSVELFGARMSLRPEVGGFFAGIFAYAIVAFIGIKLREKFGSGEQKP